MLQIYGHLSYELQFSFISSKKKKLDAKHCRFITGSDDIFCIGAFHRIFLNYELFISYVYVKFKILIELKATLIDRNHKKLIIYYSKTEIFYTSLDCQWIQL